MAELLERAMTREAWIESGLGNPSDPPRRKTPPARCLPRVASLPRLRPRNQSSTGHRLPGISRTRYVPVLGHARMPVGASGNLTRCDVFRAWRRLFPLCDSHPIDDSGPHQMARSVAHGHLL